MADLAARLQLEVALIRFTTDNMRCDNEISMARAGSFCPVCTSGITLSSRLSGLRATLPQERHAAHAGDALHAVPVGDALCLHHVFCQTEPFYFLWFCPCSEVGGCCNYVLDNKFSPRSAVRGNRMSIPLPLFPDRVTVDVVICTGGIKGGIYPLICTVVVTACWTCISKFPFPACLQMSSVPLMRHVYLEDTDADC